MADLAVNIEFDERSLREFGEAIEEYAGLRADTKGWEYPLNRTMKDVAYRAASFTRHANYPALKAMLSTKKKAARILAIRYVRVGKRPPKQPRWDEKVKYFIAQTLKSVNFMRAGWLPAAKTLDRLVHESPGISKSAAFGRSSPDIPTKNAYPQIGEAIPAHRTAEGFVCEIANQAINPRNRTSAWALMTYGGQGLDQALAFKTNDLMLYIEEAHERQAQKAGL